METPEAEPGQPLQASCVLAVSEEAVNFVVDGKVCQSMAFPLYEALQQRLSENPDMNFVAVETDGARRVQLRPVPLAEIRRQGKVELTSEDGINFGRAYRIAGIAESGGNKVSVTIADASSGEVVDERPWDEFLALARADRCRSRTFYLDMLGAHNPRLFYSVTGKIYDPKLRQQKAVAPERPAEAATKGPNLWRQWLNRNPKVAFGAAAAGALLVIAGAAMALARDRPVLGKAAPAALLDSNAAQAKLEQCLRRAENLTAQHEFSAIHREELRGLRRACAEIQQRLPGDAGLKKLDEMLVRLEAR